MVNKEKKLEKLIYKIKKLENFDGETTQYIIEKLGMREQMLRQLMLSANMSDVYSLYLERNNGSDGVEHRMAMILDDLNVIEQYANVIADLPTAHADHLTTHFNNIRIACDLNEDECLQWTLFNQSEERGGLKYFWQDVINNNNEV